jgi:hypothetical protein
VLAFGTQVRGFKPVLSRPIFQGEKNPQLASLRRGSKAVGPMSHGVEVAVAGKITGHFSPIVPPFAARISRTKGRYLRPRCIGAAGPRTRISAIYLGWLHVSASKKPSSGRLWITSSINIQYI